MHFNAPAVILFIAAFVVFGVVFATGELLFGGSDLLSGIATMAAATTFIVGDLLYFRRADDEQQGRWRFFDADAGAAIGFFPGWVFGLIAFGCGVALIVQGMR